MSKQKLAKIQLSQFIGEQRKLICEKAALEAMLKNIKALRQKLQVEQLQLTSLLHKELGEDVAPSVGPSLASSSGLSRASPVPDDSEANLNTHLDLGVNNLKKMFQGQFYAKEENTGEEEEDDDDSSDESDIFESAFEMEEYAHLDD